MGTFYIAKPELSYIHIPRTGMGMKYIIRDYLKQHFHVSDSSDWMIDHPNLKMVREYFPTGKTVSVVRNPWQRIWSFYKKIRDEGYWLDWNGQTHIEIKPINEWIIDYCNTEIPFTFPRWFNRFTNMVEFVNDGENVVDFILKSENIENDFKIVQEYLGISEPLPDISYTFNHHEYRKYFNNHSCELIRKLHERDCDAFHYTY